MAASPPESFWRSLHYFGIYRLIAAGVFVFGALPNRWWLPVIGEGTGPLFLLCIGYFLSALAIVGVLVRAGLGFNLLLTIEVATDIVFLTLMMHVGGSARSGFGYMLMVVLAGAGLVGQGRLTLFYAALATLAVLLEQGYRVLKAAADPADFIHTGSISVGFFAIALSARLLASRVVAQEELARQRGAELADQLRITRQVMRDMQDGVLVVDPSGLVRQHNPQALALLAIEAPIGSSLAEFSAPLGERYPRWRTRAGEISEAVRIPRSGRLVRVRYIPAAESGNALVYLEDLERVQARTQQIKLAALGRLTANMAHEIRNPLSAISHAAELLDEGGSPETTSRLTQIIHDNAQRLNQLVAEILELGRRDRTRPETIVLAGFLTAFVDDFALQGGRPRGALVLEAEADVVTCFDRGHLNRVLWNLVGNALRYCSGNPGSVRIIVRKEVDSGRVEIHIVDDGPGIDDATRAQVFEPFFTTDSHGTGLGLYIARELCEANGATLTLLGKAPGAHFCVTAGGKPCPQEASEETEANQGASWSSMTKPTSANYST